MIVLSGGKQDRRISSSVLHMMIRGVRVQGLELLGILYGSKLRDVELAIRIELHSHHVIDTDIGNDGAEEFRPLREGRPHQQSAVAASDNCQMSRRGVFAVNHVLAHKR